jgi:predicted nucleic acid-binding protein
VPKLLAVLDANVLYGAHARHLLLCAATQGLFDPLWSDELIDEMRRTLLKNAATTTGQVARLVELMRAHFADAWGDGYEHLVSRLHLPDDGDRHVLALAAHFEAEFIVTHNAKHFPGDALRPFGIAAASPDEFLVHLARRDPRGVVEAADLHRTLLTKSRPTWSEYLDVLRRNGFARLAAILEEPTRHA